MPMYTRDDLIMFCELAIVPEEKWCNRDSHRAHLGIGQAWALLKAGCPFTVLTSGNLATDDETIWIEINSKGFSAFELGEEDGDFRERETFYIPTPERLEQTEGRDWY